MNTTTYILSASTKREAIVFIYHNLKAGKQGLSIRETAFGCKGQCENCALSFILSRIQGVSSKN